MASAPSSRWPRAQRPSRTQPRPRLDRLRSSSPFARRLQYDPPMEIVTSTSNPRIKEIRSLQSAKGRRATGSSLAEGPHVVDALLRSSVRPTLLVLAEDSDEAIVDRHHPFDVLYVTPRVLKSMSDTEEPRGPLAVFRIPPSATIRERDTVVLHDVSDPGNVGTIVRRRGRIRLRCRREWIHVRPLVTQGDPVIGRRRLRGTHRAIG